MASLLQKQRDMNQKQNKKKHILVIDPDEDFCRNVRLYLEESYEVTARQGLEYIDYTILLNRIDLMLIEADFADFELVNALQRIHKDYPSLKIIIMYTYFPADRKIERALVKIADTTIAKPFDVFQLKTKVDHLLRVPQKI
ncbi:MAG TPA: response regulator [Calditrichaeota bacterium]|nr:response regulator [Calditrichota bacterium]